MQLVVSHIVPQLAIGRRRLAALNRVGQERDCGGGGGDGSPMGAPVFFRNSQQHPFLHYVSHWLEASQDAYSSGIRCPFSQLEHALANPPYPKKVTHLPNHPHPHGSRQKAQPAPMAEFLPVCLIFPATPLCSASNRRSFCTAGALKRGRAEQESE